jgi:hypothetical protein
MEASVGALKRVGGYLAFLLMLAPCVVAGIYAGNLNTSSSLAGWAVGIGVSVIELSLLVLLGSLKERKNFRWGIVGLVVGAIPAGIWIGGPLMTLGPYKAHLPEYMAVASLDNPDTAANDSQPLKGKMIPVDMKTKTIDPVLTDLSKELRPSSPGEVGTVAALWWKENRIGHYGASGGGAYRWECKIMVWDKTTGALLRVSRNFIGSEPPRTSNRGATQSGDKPYKEITAYLNSLGHE